MFIGFAWLLSLSVCLFGWARLSRESILRSQRGLGLGISRLIAWLARFATTGSAAPGKLRLGRPPKLQGEGREWLPERMAAGAFAIQGLAEAREAGRGIERYDRAMLSFVDREGPRFERSVRAAGLRSEAGLARRGRRYNYGGVDGFTVFT